jgi:hypothetical protein
LKTKIFYSILKNDLDLHNAGVAAVNSKVVALAPDFRIRETIPPNKPVSKRIAARAEIVPQRSEAQS